MVGEEHLTSEVSVGMIRRNQERWDVSFGLYGIRRPLCIEERNKYMKKWLLTAESGSDITREEAPTIGVEIIPMHVSMGQKSYDDGAFPPEEICRYYDRTRTLPKTSGCSPEDFTRFFDRLHRENPQAQILHLAYSAVTTVSCGSARIAAEGRDYVTIVDTKHVSVGLRAVVLQTAELLRRDPQISREDLVARVLDICDQTRMCFLPADLTYLHAGGRCGNLAFFGGQLLKLHPCIEILDGKLVATQKYRGNFRKVVPELIRAYTAANRLSREKLWFIWAPGLEEDVKAAAEKTACQCGYSNVEWVKTGCVITTHGGPGAFGIVGLRSK